MGRRGVRSVKARPSRRVFVTSAWGFALSLAVACRSADEGSEADDHPELRGEAALGRETDGKRLVQFLKDCTPEERVQLGQSLHMFPKVESADFGKFGLPARDHFTDDSKKASAEHPIRPTSFNEVPAAIVLEAVRAHRIDSELTTPYRILSALVHTCFNEALAVTIDRDKINYHGIVEWVARKKGVAKKQIESADTFELEQAVAKQYLAKIWDQLTVEQRQELLTKIEKQGAFTIADKAAIAAMGGGAAIAALGTTVAMTGFAFYTTMAVVISTTAGMLGLALPMAAYTGASSNVALLSGPVGWLIAAVAILGGLTYFALADVDRTAAFVMTMNVTKASRGQVGQSIRIGAELPDLDSPRTP